VGIAGPESPLLSGRLIERDEELEVLAPVAGGLRNGWTAERLVGSECSVFHDVPVILRELAATIGTRVAAEAARPGVVSPIG
jgi:DNA-binding NarL/FixJ family response regulator